MRILAIDPGPSECGVVVIDSAGIVLARVMTTADTLALVRHRSWGMGGSDGVCVCEWFKARGMPLGDESLQTVRVEGAIREAWFEDSTFHPLSRADVKLHLCGSAKAKDPNVRAALLDRYGGKAAIAPGRKGKPATRKRPAEPFRAPGPLHGLKEHCWAALAVAVTWADLHGEGV